MGDTGGDQLFEKVEKQLEDYQDAYLDASLANLQYELALTEQDKVEAKVDLLYAGLMKYLRETVEANGPNTPAIKAEIVKIINQQKEKGSYDPEEWDWFEE